MRREERAPLGVMLYIWICMAMRACVCVCVCVWQKQKLCFLTALMCVDSLARGALSALLQPMCYIAACAAARN